MNTITETVSDLGRQAKESAEELGRSAGRRLDEARDETGDALHATASTLRKGSEAIDSLANGAADRLDATASYVEDHDLRDVFTSLRRFARRHLTGSVVTAAAIGFLAGSTLSRMTHTCGRSPEATKR